MPPRANPRKSKKSSAKFIAEFRALLHEIDGEDDRDELAQVLMDEAIGHFPFQKAFDKVLEDRRIVKQHEMDVPRAMDVLQRDYDEDVEAIAKAIKEQVDSGEISSAEDLQTTLHQDVDGAQRVIYTRQAQLGLVFSNNSGAYEQSFGEEGIVEGGDIQWSRLMYAALEQDVIEELERIGVDVNDPAPEEDEEEDEDEDGEEAEPACARSMGTLCACHAAGLDPREPCDTSETRAARLSRRR